MIIFKGTRWTGGSSSVEIHALVHKEYCCRFCVKRVKEADFIAGKLSGPLAVTLPGIVGGPCPGNISSNGKGTP